MRCWAATLMKFAAIKCTVYASMMYDSSSHLALSSIYIVFWERGCHTKNECVHTQYNSRKGRTEEAQK